MTIQVERTDYRGWADCVRLASDHLELVVSAGFGPRVLHLAAPGGDNLFWLDPDWIGRRGDGGAWVNYGGHRLWHAPEAHPRSYAPDEGPVEVELHGDGLTARAATEAATGVAKTLELRLAPDAARATVTHTLANRGPWPLRLAPWALSVMAPGGVAIVPLPPKAEHGPDGLLPNGRIALWPYTDMSDERWTWGRRFALLRQGDAGPQKAGFAVPDGWAAYARDGALFVKRFAFDADAAYPDHGSSVEVFTNREMLELETLAPLTTLEPGAHATHVERWELHGGVATPADEAAVVREVLPRLTPDAVDAA